MRNGLPGSPALGVTFDVASYFWTMLMVAVSVIMLLWNYVFTTKVEKKGPANKEFGKTAVDLTTPFLA